MFARQLNQGRTATVVALTAVLALLVALPALAAQRYEIQQGDTMASIAENHALDGWRVIYEANPEINDPDVIYPGDTLVVPNAGNQQAGDGGAPPADAQATGQDSTQDNSTQDNSTQDNSTQDSSEAAQKAEESGEAQASAPAPGSDSVWTELAACESDGRWHLDSRYNGGLQFAPSTWQAHGGEQYAPSADEATRAEQIAVARSVRDTQGWSAWPACADELGLR